MLGHARAESGRWLGRFGGQLSMSNQYPRRQAVNAAVSALSASDMRECLEQIMEAFHATHHDEDLDPELDWDGGTVERVYEVLPNSVVWACRGEGWS